MMVRNKVGAHAAPLPASWKPALLNDLTLPLDESVAAVATSRESELERLIAAVAGGDSAALGELYDLTVGKVHALVRGMVRDADDAQEITCEVYTKAWQAAATYDRARSSVMTWLMMLARSRCIDLLRQRKVRNRVFVSDEEAALGADSDAASAHDLLQLLQSGSAVHEAMASLSPVRQQILSLAFFQDMTHPEIAVATGLPLGTVKSHLRRALLALREALEP